MDGRNIHISNYQTKYYKSNEYSNPLFSIMGGIDYRFSNHWGIKSCIRYWINDLISKSNSIFQTNLQGKRIPSQSIDVTAGLSFRF